MTQLALGPAGAQQLGQPHRPDGDELHRHADRLLRTLSAGSSIRGRNHRGMRPAGKVGPILDAWQYLESHVGTILTQTRPDQPRPGRTPGHTVSRARRVTFAVSEGSPL